MTEYNQERPVWCPHQDCIFKRRAMDSLCGGQLPKVIKETDEFKQLHINDQRICLNETHQPPPHHKIVDLKVNDSDLDWFRFVFDALDRKKTSWLSRIGEQQGKMSALPRLENVKEDAEELHQKLKDTEHEPLLLGMVTELGYAINSLTDTKRTEKPL